MYAGKCVGLTFNWKKWCPGWESNHPASLITRKLLIFQDAKNAKIGTKAGSRYTAGTRFCPPVHHSWTSPALTLSGRSTSSSVSSVSVIMHSRLPAELIAYASQINVMAIAALLWKAAPRVDHLFEASKPRLAEASRNIGILWAEYEIGRIRKFALLINHYGWKKTVRGLLGVGVDGWKFERRMNRGTWQNRAYQSGDLRQRRFDDPSVVSLVARRACLCNATSR